jgi:hypothetical protein
LLRALAIVVACILSAGVAVAMTLDKNIDAITAAIDPSKGPSIVEPIFPSHHAFSALGGPGPYTPEVPTRLGISGVAVIQCGLAQGGKLSGCTLLADAPLHLDFGEAALKMASVGYLTAAPPANFKDGDQVRVVVVFRIPRGGYSN